MRTKLIIVLSVLFILIANFAYWLTNSFYDSEKFNKNTVAAFKQQEVRDAIASEAVERIFADNPRLNSVASGPAEAAISGVLNSSYLEPVIERASEGFQKYVVGGQNEVAIDLTRVNTLISVITRATGEVAEPVEIKNTTLVIVPENAFPRLESWLKTLTTLGPIAGLLGLGVLLYLIYRDSEKWNIIKQIGIILLVGTLINLLLVPFAASLIRQNPTNPNVGVIASEAFTVFSKSYINQLLLLIVAGLGLLLGWYYQKKSKGVPTKRKVAGEN